MVLAQRVGRPRSFLVGLLLTIVTFGIYAVYWNYKAHNEVYRQFELQRESRDEGMVWYVLGLVVPPFLLAYLWVMAANVTYVRERIGLRRRMTPGRFVGLIAVGVGLLVLGAILLELTMAAGGAVASESFDVAVETLGAVFTGMLLAAVVLTIVAYYFLQKDINEVYQAYDVRMRYLQAQAAGPPEPAPSAAAPVPQALRMYWADRAVPPPASPAVVPPVSELPGALRAELAHLREAHPGLAGVHEVEALLARAEHGDEAALDEADERLRALKDELEERQALLAHLDEADERLRALPPVGEAEAREEVARERALAQERLGALDARLFGDGGGDDGRP